MEPRSFLRLEGLSVLAIALGGYLSLQGPIWLLVVLALAPDLSMAGYLAGPGSGVSRTTSPTPTRCPWRSARVASGPTPTSPSSWR